MKEPEKDIIDWVADELRQAGIGFEREVAIGGLRPDFLIPTPDKKTIAVDVKTWAKHQGFRSRAAHQASLYEEIAGIDKALVYVDGLERSSISNGVVNSKTLLPTILSLFPTPPHPSDASSEEREAAKKSERRGRATSTTRPALQKVQLRIFAAMPFDRKYDDVFFFAMSHAAQTNGGVCERVDTSEFSGDIVSEIQSMIRRSRAVIADLSGANPNVLYETGYAHALKIPTVHICSSPLAQLPFDVSHWNTLEYEVGQVHRLQEPLAKRVKAALAGSK